MFRDRPELMDETLVAKRVAGCAVEP